MANEIITTGTVNALRSQLRGIFYDGIVNGIRLSNSNSLIGSTPLHGMTILSQL